MARLVPTFTPPHPPVFLPALVLIPSDRLFLFSFFFLRPAGGCGPCPLRRWRPAGMEVFGLGVSIDVWSCRARFKYVYLII